MQRGPTKSKAKSNKGAAHSAQQIVNINLGEKLSDRIVRAVKQDEDNDATAQPSLLPTPSRKQKATAPVSDMPKSKKPKKMLTTQPFKQDDEDPTNSRRKSLGQMKSSIDSYQRAMDDLSPNLRTPDIADVPDRLLTPKTNAQIQETIQWLENATRIARSRASSFIIPQNQTQPLANLTRGYIPMDQQYEIQQLRAQRDMAERELAGARSGQAPPGQMPQTPIRTPPPAYSSPLITLSPGASSDAVILQKKIAELEQEIKSSQAVTDGDKDEIKRLNDEIARLIMLKDRDAELIKQEMDEILQDASRLQGVVNQQSSQPSREYLYNKWNDYLSSSINGYYVELNQELAKNYEKDGQSQDVINLNAKTIEEVHQRLEAMIGNAAEELTNAGLSEEQILELLKMASELNNGLAGSAKAKVANEAERARLESPTSLNTPFTIPEAVQRRSGRQMMNRLNRLKQMNNELMQQRTHAEQLRKWKEIEQLQKTIELALDQIDNQYITPEQQTQFRTEFASLTQNPFSDVNQTLKPGDEVFLLRENATGTILSEDPTEDGNFTVTIPRDDASGDEKMTEARAFMIPATGLGLGPMTGDQRPLAVSAPVNQSEYTPVNIPQFQPGYQTPFTPSPIPQPSPSLSPQGSLRLKRTLQNMRDAKAKYGTPVPLRPGLTPSPAPPESGN